MCKSALLTLLTYIFFQILYFHSFNSVYLGGAQVHVYKLNVFYSIVDKG